MAEQPKTRSQGNVPDDVFHRGPGYLPPEERAPRPGTHVSKDPLNTHVFQVDAQVKAFDAYLRENSLVVRAVTFINGFLLRIFQNHALVAPKMFSNSRWKAPTPRSLTAGTKAIISYQEKKASYAAEPDYGPVFGELWELMKNLGCTLSGAVTGDFAPLGRAGRYVKYQMEKAVEMTMTSSLVTKLMGWASIYDLLDERVKGAIGCCFGMGSMIERSIKKGVMLLRMECGTFRGAAQLDVPLCVTYQETRDVKDMFSALLSKALAPDAWMFIGVGSAAYMGEAVKNGVFAGAVFLAGGFEACKMSLAGVKAVARQGGLEGALERVAEIEPVVGHAFEILYKFNATTKITCKDAAQSIYNSVKNVRLNLTDIRSGKTGIFKGYNLIIGEGAKVYTIKSTFGELLKWSPDWLITQNLLFAAGVERLDQLKFQKYTGEKGEVVPTKAIHCGAVYVPAAVKKRKEMAAAALIDYKCKRCGNVFKLAASTTTPFCRRGSKTGCGANGKNSVVRVKLAYTAVGEGGAMKIKLSREAEPL